MAKAPPKSTGASSTPEADSSVVEAVAPGPASIAFHPSCLEQAPTSVVSSNAPDLSPTGSSIDPVASGDVSVALALPSDSTVAISSPARTPTGHHSLCSASAFFKLSNEVRAMIYRYLLSATECRKIHPESGRFHFEPNILRANREVYTGGVQVLYGENMWVMFSENTGTLLELLRMAKIPVISLRKKADYGRLEKGHRTPALHVSLLTRSPISWRPTCFVVPLTMAHRVCCWLSTDKILREESTMRLHFDKEQIGKQGKLATIFDDVREAYTVQVSGRMPPTEGEKLIQMMEGPRDGAKQRTMLAQAFLTRADTHWTLYADPDSLDNSMSIGQFASASTFYVEGARETMAAIEACIQGGLEDADDLALLKLKTLRGELLHSMTICATFSNNRGRGDVRRVRQALFRIIEHLSMAQHQPLLAAVLKRIAKQAFRPQDHYLQLWALFEIVRKGVQDAEAGQMIASFRQTVEGNRELKSLLGALLRPASEDETCWIAVLAGRRIRQLVTAAIEHADLI